MTSAHARPSWAVLGAVSLGGALGSLGRWGVGLALPFEVGAGWPWASFLVNVTGSFVLGVVTVVVLQMRPLSRLARPFWGAGVCGGYTTFSAFALEVHHHLAGGRVAVALAYTAASLLGGVGAVAFGTVAGRWGVRRW